MLAILGVPNDLNPLHYTGDCNHDPRNAVYICGTQPWNQQIPSPGIGLDVPGRFNITWSQHITWSSVFPRWCSNEAVWCRGCWKLGTNSQKVGARQSAMRIECSGEMAPVSFPQGANKSRPTWTYLKIGSLLIWGHHLKSSQAILDLIFWGTNIHLHHSFTSYFSDVHQGLPWLLTIFDPACGGPAGTVPPNSFWVAVEIKVSGAPRGSIFGVEDFTKMWAEWSKLWGV